MWRRCWKSVFPTHDFRKSSFQIMTNNIWNNKLDILKVCKTLMASYMTPADFSRVCYDQESARRKKQGKTSKAERSGAATPLLWLFDFRSASSCFFFIMRMSSSVLSIRKAVMCSLWWSFKQCGAMPRYAGCSILKHLDWYVGPRSLIDVSSASTGWREGSGNAGTTVGDWICYNFEDRNTQYPSTTQMKWCNFFRLLPSNVFGLAVPLTLSWIL